MANKMAEETPRQVTQVTTKDPKKVAQGRRLAEYNCKKREELKAQEGGHKEDPKTQEGSKEGQESSISSTQCYGIGAIIVVAGVVAVVYRVWGNTLERGKGVSSNPVSIASTHVVEPSRSKTKMYEME